MEYNEKYDVFITQIEMPLRIKAFIKSINGHVFITVNSNLSDEAKQREVIHEISHLKKCDLINEMPVAFIERDVKKGTRKAK